MKIRPSVCFILLSLLLVLLSQPTCCSDRSAWRPAR